MAGWVTFVRTEVAIIGAVSAFWATPAAADPSALPPRPLIPFSQAPPRVQSGLVHLLAGCSQTPAQLRRSAWFAVGPVAGPGTKAFMFAVNDLHWRGSYKTFYYASVCGALVPRWFELWMPLGHGRYRGYWLADSSVDHHGPAFVVLTPDPNCDLEKMSAGGWWDCYHVLAWDRTHGRFRAITPDMRNAAAWAWPAEHGYVGYY